MNNREAFEAWFNETYFEHNLNRDEQGDYISTTPRLIWQAWQAALASQAQQTCKGKFFNQYSDGSIHTFCTSDEAFNHSINNTLEPEKVCFPVSELQSQAQQPIEAKPYGYVTTLRNGTKHFYESLPYLDNAVKCDTVYLQLQAQQEPAKCDTCGKIKNDPMGVYCSNPFHLIPPAPEGGDK